MQYVSLSDRLSLSRIVQGFWRLPSWGMDTEELVEFLNGCLERGVTTFDSAEIYGCEQQLGAGLARLRRSDYQIVSKTGISQTQVNGRVFGYYDTSYERVKDACKRSIDLLNCEYLDLYLIHREDPLIDHEQTARALLELKSEGLVREIGVSNFDTYKWNAFNRACGGQLRTNQIEWNPCCYEHFNSGMMDLLCEQKIHPMIWSPLAGGRLLRDGSPTYARARAKLEEIAVRHGVTLSAIVYAWILKHPVGALPLVGSHRLDRLDEAIKALKIELSLVEWFEIYVASGQQQIR